MDLTLGQVLSAGVLELIGEEGSVRDAAPDAIKQAIRDRLRRVLRLEEPRDTASLDTLVALISVAFLGAPRDFDPRALVRSLPPEIFELVLKTIDEMEDGSDGPFIFFQLERAKLKGLHVPGHDWEFHRFNRHVGECRFYLKDNMRSGKPLVTASTHFGVPNLDEYVGELVADCKAAGGKFEFPGDTLPGFDYVSEVQPALREHGLVSYTRWDRRPMGKVRMIVVEDPHGQKLGGDQAQGAHSGQAAGESGAQHQGSSDGGVGDGAKGV